jgi:hypothetical protein
MAYYITFSAYGNDKADYKTYNEYGYSGKQWICLPEKPLVGQILRYICRYVFTDKMPVLRF